MEEQAIGNKIKVKYVKDRPKTIWIFCLIFVTLAFLASGIALFLINQERMPFYKETTAIITEIDVDRYWDSEGTETTEYDVFVDYTVDGTKYTHREYGSWDISMYEGKEITIYYDSRDPGKPLESPTNLLIISCVFWGGSLIPLIIAAKQIGEIISEKHRIKELKEKGIRKRLPIVMVENVNDFESDAYHGKRISNRKYKITISTSGRAYRYNKLKNKGNLSSREMANLRDENAGRKTFYIFGCEHEGLVYESLCYHKSEKVYEGCTAEVYFDEKQYNDAIANKTWVKNYFIDMESIQTGKRIVTEESKKH